MVFLVLFALCANEARNHPLPHFLLVQSRQGVMCVELKALRGLLRCLRRLRFSDSHDVVHVDEIRQRMQPWSTMQPIIEARSRSM